MDLEKNLTEAGFYERLTRHSSAFSLSLSFRGPAKRGSIVEHREEQPTCLESVHYPVFGKQNPRNSSHIRQIFRRSESRTSSSDPPRQNDGAPTFPRRSLHKARSGLLALRAGLFGRSSRQDGDLFESEAKSLPKHGHVHRSTHGFSDISSSTQEDINFGTDLYPNGRAQPRTLNDTDVNAIKQVPSVHSLKNTISAPQPRTSSCSLVHDSQPAFDQTVSTPADQPFAYESNQEKIVMSHLPTDEEKWAEQDLSIVEDIQKNRADCLTPSVASEDQHKAGPLSPDSAEDEELGGTSLLCYNQDVVLEKNGDFLKNWLNHEESASKKIEGLRRLSETRNAPSLEMKHKDNDSKESLELPDYSTPSIVGSETLRRRGSMVIRPEALVIQERVLDDDSLECQASESPVSESRKCSANVKIAFPGLYHELLEQWVRENEMSSTLYPGFPGLESESTSSTTHLPSLPSTTSPHHNPDIQPHHHTELPWSLDTHLNSRLANIFNGFQKENALIPFTSLAHPRIVTVHCVQDSAIFPCTMDDYTGNANAPTTRSREGQSDGRRHSFGIHISERNETASRPSTTQVSHRETLRRSSEDRQSPVHNEPFSPPPGLWGAADSQCDDSDFSTNYTRDSSAINSANYTSPTSASSAPWSPLDSPIDEEVIFRATHRDEYWMADGKNSSYYPDRGDLPVKGERVADDGRMYCASGSGRGSSSRFRQLTRADFANTMRRSFRRDAQASEEQEEGESAEDAPSSSQAQV